MSKKLIVEYLQEIYERYKKSEKEEKSKILDAFCKICSYHKKYAIKLLNEIPFRKDNIQTKR